MSLVDSLYINYTASKSKYFRASSKSDEIPQQFILNWNGKGLLYQLSQQPLSLRIFVQDHENGARQPWATSNSSVHNTEASIIFLCKES